MEPIVHIGWFAKQEYNTILCYAPLPLNFRILFFQIHLNTQEIEDFAEVPKVFPNCNEGILASRGF